MTKGLELDLHGRLRNFRLPASRALVPLFEAVVNALQAIEAGNCSLGEINIRVIRDGQYEFPALADGATTRRREPIRGFRITDNGLGFTDENYHSFCTSDSQHKAAIGGRGVGRFSWLKAFRSVRIDSTYRDTDRKIKCRNFKFSEEGITDLSEAEASATHHSGTTISLEDMHDMYQKEIPKNCATIADRLVHHCLVAIRGCRCPVKISINDEEEEVDVRGEVDRLLAAATVDDVDILGCRFRMTHIRIHSSENSGNRISFLANSREVRTDSLQHLDPHLKSKLQGADGETFWWVSLVEADILDRKVSSERDAFLFDEHSSSLFPDEFSMQRIRASLDPPILRRIEPLLAPERERAVAQAERYIATKAPEYRHLVAVRRDEVACLPADLSDEKLDLELHRVNYQFEASLREKGQRLMASENVNERMYDEFLSETNAVGKANLAKYVVQRRVILSLLKRSLSLRDSGKYELEEAIHKIIFPLKTTSDEVPYEKLNLWILDERLAYHAYLASDKELRSIPVLASQDQQRPDIIIFNSPFAFAEQSAPFSAIVIIEFKRPARTDYDDSDNPISQVYDYVRRVRAGAVKDRSGRPLNVAAHVPFYCYVVCDLTRRLKAIAEDLDLTQAPDSQGYYGYNSKLVTYIEVLSFDKLVADAEKRNRVLFDKLNLPK